MYWVRPFNLEHDLLEASLDLFEIGHDYLKVGHKLLEIDTLK